MGVALFGRERPLGGEPETARDERGPGNAERRRLTEASLHFQFNPSSPGRVGVRWERRGRGGEGPYAACPPASSGARPGRTLRLGKKISRGM